MKGKTRRSVVVLAIVAMIAALLAVPVTAGAATPATASYTADYSACPSGSIPASSFTDSSASFAKADIDCIAYYGISLGTSATTFDPSSVVTREQMALFLIRAAGPAGVTLGAGVDQGFTDISGLSADSQKAINQLAELGITKGTSATTYGPAGTVTREQMALFLNRFLSKATAGPGGKWAAALAGAAVDFTDIGGVSFEAHQAVLNLFELGVTTGTTATTFSPSMSVTREQMAAFIGRSLAHTNARPAGVLIQTAKTSGEGALAPVLSISQRDASFMPVFNSPIDIFRFVATSTVTSAFTTTGACVTTGEVTAVSSGANVCMVDLTDNATNAQGNVSATGAVASGDTATFYAWSAAAGTAYDNDVHAAKSVTVASSLPAVALLITSTTPANAKNDAGTVAGGPAGICCADYHKFGTTVTWTLQAIDSLDKPVAKAGVDVNLTFRRYVDSVQVANIVKSGTTDAAGMVQFTFVESDPSTAAGNPGDNSIQIRDDVFFNSAGLAFDSSKINDKDLLWDDETSAAETIKVAGSSAYVTNSTTATNSATATLYDQYGLPLSGASVAFTGAAGSLDVTPINRSTNSAGQASVAWTHTSGTNQAEVVTADAGGGVTDTDTVYWVKAAASGTYTATPVLVADTASDKIVFLSNGGDPDAGLYLVATYDSGDQFNSGGAITFAAFEKLLDDTTADSIAVVYTTSGVSQWTRS